MTKSKRDITLGEMQDECLKWWNNGNFGYCGKCQYMNVCCHYERYCPAQLNLVTPRFTDSQKMFLRGWMAIGAVEAHKCTIEGEGDPFDVIDFYDADGCCIATVSRIDWLNNQVEFGVDMELFDAIGDVPCAK